MKLHFRGQTYFQPLQQISTIISENTGCYRGKKYNLRVTAVACQSQWSESQTSATVYKYRGVPYVVEHHHVPTEPDKTLVYSQ